MRFAIKTLPLGLIIILVISQIIAQNIQTCTVRATQNVNRRFAPGTQFRIAGALDANQPVTAVLQFTDSDGIVWWQLTDSSWVRSDVVLEDENCSELPDRTTQLALTRTARADSLVPTLPAGTQRPGVASTASVPFEVRFLATVTTNALSIREGPGLLYARTGTRHLKGDRLVLVGRISDASWVQVRGSEVGWVSARSIAFNGNVLSLPVVAVEDELIEDEE